METRGIYHKKKSPWIFFSVSGKNADSPPAHVIGVFSSELLFPPPLLLLTFYLLWGKGHTLWCLFRGHRTTC